MSGPPPLKQQILLEILEGGPARWVELKERLDISDPHISNLLNRTVARGLIQRLEHGLYDLTPAGRELLEAN